MAKTKYQYEVNEYASRHSIEHYPCDDEIDLSRLRRSARTITTTTTTDGSRHGLSIWSSTNFLIATTARNCVAARLIVRRFHTSVLVRRRPEASDEL